MTSRMLSVREVADQLGTRTHSVLTLIKTGQLRASDISLTPGGRPRWRIDPDDLSLYLARKTFQAPAPRRRRKKPTNVKEFF
jgi:hypothetical protein